jgi:hypothetical protein
MAIMLSLDVGEIDLLIRAVITAKRPIEDSRDMPHPQKRENLAPLDAMIDKLREAKANAR